MMEAFFGLLFLTVLGFFFLLFWALVYLCIKELFFDTESGPALIRLPDIGSKSKSNPSDYDYHKDYHYYNGRKRKYAKEDNFDCGDDGS